MATRLMHFGRFLTKTDPGLAALDRRRHIEPYLASLADAVNGKDDGMISIGERQCRVLAVRNFLAYISARAWECALPPAGLPW